MSDIKELNAKLAKIMKHFGIVKKEEPNNEEALLRKKYEAMQKKKLADSLKPYCRTDGIKSVGNGL